MMVTARQSVSTLGRWIAIGAVWGCLAPIALAQGSDPVGGEFQANTYTPGGQGVPAVDVARGGETVVVWQSGGSSGTDGDSFSIQARRFDGDGQALGDDFQVNTYTTHPQFQPDVAVGAGGEVLVVWASGDFLSGAGPDGDLEGISAQLYDASGSAVGGELVVNAYTTSSQRSPRVVARPDGGFLVVWASFNASGGDDLTSWSIQGRQLDATGAPENDEFQVNELIASAQRSPDVAISHDGSFVIAWESFTTSPGDDTSDWGIVARAFDASGTALAGDFQVNTFTTGAQRYPSVVAGASETFLVTWHSEGSSGDDSSQDSIQAQRLAADGSPLGGELQLNSLTTGYQWFPRASRDASGRFMVVWDSGRYGGAGGDGDGASVRGVQLDSDLVPIVAESEIHTFTGGDQLRPVVASGSVGDFVVVWGSSSSAGPDLDYSVQAQRFGDPALMFLDGFESGDTSAWTSTNP